MSDTDTPSPRADCPWCGEGESLFIAAITILTPKPLGTWSLAGAQMKTSASMQTLPVLVCGACQTESIGETVDDDEVGFNPENNRHLSDDDFAYRQKYLLKTV